MTNETIIIVDRDNHIKWTLKAFLESEHYTVIILDTLKETLQNFSEVKISGLITDYRISHSNTIKAIQEFKRIFPEAYVMMLAYNDVDESQYEEIINSGVDDYFLRPFSFRKILVHLKKGLMQHNICLTKN